MRILYVEDEADIQAVTKLALETLGGHTVELCDSGEQAVEKARAFRPDVILLDVMMPGQDGPTTFRQLRNSQETDDIPVVFLTAKAQSEEIARLTEMGALEVITKPFDPMTISDRIQDIYRNRGQ